MESRGVHWLRLRFAGGGAMVNVGGVAAARCNAGQIGPVFGVSRFLNLRRQIPKQIAG